jgi:hypothetical protein
MPYVYSRVKSVEDFIELLLDITLLVDVTQSDKYDAIKYRIRNCFDSFDKNLTKQSKQFNFRLLSDAYSDIALSNSVFEMDEDYNKMNILRKIKIEKLNLLQ